MAENDIILMSYLRGTPLPADVEPVLDEALQALARIADPDRRLKVQGRIEGARNGATDSIVFMVDSKPVGLVSCEAQDGDVQLVFGHVLRAHEDMTARAFERAVHELEKRFRVVRSIFTWPEPDAFSAAARAMGFAVVERMDMIRDVDEEHAVRQLPRSLEIMPYSSQYFEDIARLMCETSDPTDRVVLPLFASVAGCRTLLGQMLGGTFGAFQPGLSFVALDGGRMTGYLITASYGEGIVHIDDVAVAPGFRGKGLASAMIDRLIRDGGAAGNKSVLLTVTTTNQDALRLYLHKGFTLKETFRQHVYVSNGK